ncbi:hypothetical protein V2J09_001718 [Rumex salicifolius]
METKVLAVCIVVGFLGLLSTILGFAAEGKRIKGPQVIRDVNNPSVCVYPRTPAFGLGLSAAVSLLLTLKVVAFAAAKDMSVPQAITSSGRWQMTFVLAFLLLLGGAALNDQHNMDSMYLNNYCYVVKPGVFAGAATLSFISVTLGLIYYISLTAGKTGTVGPSVVPTAQANGIAMGRPQIPPTTHEPVFVHEDTYARRQLT